MVAQGRGIQQNYQTLMPFCNGGHPDEVAPVWGRLANYAKSEQHTILVQEFQRVCMARGLSLTNLVCMLIVTSALKQMIMGFQFVGNGIDKLSTGCQPFQVAYAGTANPLQAMAAASIGGNQQAQQGKQSASLANYWTLPDKEKVNFLQDTVDKVSVMLG